MPAADVDVAGAVELALDLSARAHRGEPESDMAEAVRAWAHARSFETRVEPVGDFGANLLAGPPDGPDLAFYGHLDISLRLSPWEDQLLLGRPEPPAAPWCDGEIVWGAGVGVALAPTCAGIAVAASLAAVSGPHRVGAMVVSGGTHRAPPPWPLERPKRTHSGMAAGVRAALDSGFRPRAVISPKGGAPAPLWEEPGSLYLAVTLQDAFGPALTRQVGDHLAGAPAQVAHLLPSIARWKEVHLSERRGREGQAGADVVVGALVAGSPSKPDLLPDAARAYLYVVTVPGDDEGSVAGSLAVHLRADADLAGRPIEVTPYASLPPGRTDRSHPLVQQVSDAWRKRWPLPSLTGWRGSTDGALLRSLGIPTVRVGPELLRHPDDPRVEGVRVADLEEFCALWYDAALAYLGR